MAIWLCRFMEDCTSFEDIGNITTCLGDKASDTVEG